MSDTNIRKAEVLYNEVVLPSLLTSVSAATTATIARRRKVFILARIFFQLKIKHKIGWNKNIGKFEYVMLQTVIFKVTSPIDENLLTLLLSSKEWIETFASTAIRLYSCVTWFEKGRQEKTNTNKK